MAQRPPGPGFFDAFDDFERTVDSLFDDLLISRWRVPAQPGADVHTQVADRGDHYEIRMEHVVGDARQLELEASERRLIVHSQGQGGKSERIVDFRHPVDPEGASAELKGTELRITLPKRRARKIAVR